MGAQITQLAPYGYAGRVYGDFSKAPVIPPGVAPPPPAEVAERALGGRREVTHWIPLLFDLEVVMAMRFTEVPLPMRTLEPVRILQIVPPIRIPLQAELPFQLRLQETFACALTLPISIKVTQCHQILLQSRLNLDIVWEDSKIEVWAGRARKAREAAYEALGIRTVL